MNTTTPGVKDLTRSDYEAIRRLVYAKSGINLGDHKIPLVRSRLAKLVRIGGFNSFRAYFRDVVDDATGEKLCTLLDAISTNITHLFRESRHFDALRELIARYAQDKSWRARHRSLRIWSAACSSGEEPYSIAMVAHTALREHPGIEVKLLATDLSVQMLSKAKLGVYTPEQASNAPIAYRNTYMRRIKCDGEPAFQVTPELRRLVTFSRFNLMTDVFPFRKPFHVIFCRNVMIYFDKPTQEVLVGKFARHLFPGGYLMIGHSESLHGVKHAFRNVEPAVYRLD